MIYFHNICRDWLAFYGLNVYSNVHTYIQTSMTIWDRIKQTTCSSWYLFGIFACFWFCFKLQKHQLKKRLRRKVRKIYPRIWYKKCDREEQQRSRSGWKHIVEESAGCDDLRFVNGNSTTKETHIHTTIFSWALNR